MNRTVHKRRLAILGDALDDVTHRRGHLGRPRLQLRRRARTIAECSPVVRHHQQRRPGQACFGSIFSMISSGSVTSVPPQPVPAPPPGNSGPASTAAAHADAGRLHVQQACRLVLGEHAGDVVVDHDHLVDMAEPLLARTCRWSPSRSRRACAPRHAVDDRRPAGLHDHGRAAVDGELDRLRVAQRQQRVAGDAPSFLLPPVR
jgi:hypothetical protein